MASNCDCTKLWMSCTLSMLQEDMGCLVRGISGPHPYLRAVVVIASPDRVSKHWTERHRGTMAKADPTKNGS